MTGLPPPHESLRRSDLLERLIVALTSGDQSKLPIKTRVLDDPTVALLDAWATVGDVLGFYLDRISDEGYVATAREPGSILALSSLMGRTPPPGLAAQTYLALTLNPDPADNAVQFDSGLLFQTVPGPGEQPQTFESTARLVARPSWNLLSPKSGQPPVMTHGTGPPVSRLLVEGTATSLAPNDAILLGLTTDADPVPVSVSGVEVDHVGGVTNVRLDAVPAPSVGDSGESEPAALHVAAAKQNGGLPADVTGAIDALLTDGLSKQPSPLPASANELGQTAGSVFRADSDAIPRLLTALRPEVSSTLYAALDTTSLGDPTVTSASALRVKAAPFGANAPPKPVFNQSGQPAGTRDWPIGDTFTLQLSMTEQALTQAITGRAGHGLMVNALANMATRSSPAVIDTRGSQPWRATPEGFGELEVRQSGRTWTLEHAGQNAANAPALGLEAEITHDRTVRIKFGDAEQVWDPGIRAPWSAQIGPAQLSIAWAPTAADDAPVTFTLEQPLPLTALNVLPIDGIYTGIVRGTPVLIECAPDTEATRAPSAPRDVTYPVVAYVDAVDTVAMSAYGISSTVTRLTLVDSAGLPKNWIGSNDLLQSALRPLTVRAQPEALSLARLPVTDDVGGATIDLDTVVAGIAPGRLIAVTGTRTDLPGTATVQSGEIAMVSSVSAGAGAGDTTFSTLKLASELAYTYKRDTIKIYGNVVPGHQGATINEVLGSGQPSQAHQTFTLSAGPVLADPVSTDGGSRSSLRVTVDGVGYAEVERLGDSTPPQSFMTGTDAMGQTTVVFAAPLPPGASNIAASYRAGNGAQGNVRADQVTQLLTRPASLSAVTNPLPASGGTPGAGPEDVRTSLPAGLGGLGRIATVSDCADFARSWAGVGKASAAATSAGDSRRVLITIAGNDPTPLDPKGALRTGIETAIAAAVDPTLQVEVEPAPLFLIVLQASVAHDPLVGWDMTANATRAALLASFGYAQRQLGQDVAVSDLIAAAHAAGAVRSFVVTGLVLVPASASASDLSTKLAKLLTNPVPEVYTLELAESEWRIGSGEPSPAAVAFLSDSAPDALILTEQLQ
ncbi:MAG: hypothetical protein ACXVHB_16115 [Solirubrobacteraceae bacterium]